MRLWTPVYRGRMRRPHGIAKWARRLTCMLLGHDVIDYYGPWCQRHGYWITNNRERRPHK